MSDLQISLLAIGALVATTALTSTLQPGDLGSTFGGGPLVSAAALATIEVIDREQLYQNVQTVSAEIRGWATARGLPVQGLGLLLGIRMPSPHTGSSMQTGLFGQRILTGTASDPSILRLLPPLTFTSAEAGLLLTGLGKALDA